jgi:SAM-dependent methyltransferase
MLWLLPAMDDLIDKLPAHSRVLDLGARSGSFHTERTDLTVVRLDMEIPAGRKSGAYISADAARMPFRDGAFELIVSNHSLEHFRELEATLREMGRVLRRDGALYIAVPDATTLTDRIYRWMARGGGHVNAFRSPQDVTGVVERLTGLPHRSTIVLYTGLSFLNWHNTKGWPGKKIIFFGFGSERYLALFVWLLKRIDKTFGTRLGVYGWVFYFGCAEPERTDEWVNVCVRCGAGHPAADAAAAARRLWWGPKSYRCLVCGGFNLLS